MQLQDTHGRHIHKLRIQLTDACNFRCFYCMSEATSFLPVNSLLSPSEIIQISQTVFHLGVDEIRVTGGEPTLRPEFDEIMTKLSTLPWKKFGLTTNGLLLGEKLPLLKQLGCDSINISMDSLQESTFNAITRRPHFQKVYSNVLKAAEMGFSVKVNVVVARGRNDHELFAFLHFAQEHGIEVRFLELMRVGPSIAEHERLFISAEEMIARIKTRYDLHPIESPKDSTSFGFQTDHGAKLGFIASESKPFCSTCSRLRLAATGKLRACLFSDQGINLRGKDPLDYPEILREVMGMKPVGRISEVHESMNQIGG